MKVFETIRSKLTSFQIIIIGFLGVILIGTLLLMLPAASQNNCVTPFNEALFTSTSAVCVTGLVVQDTATYWSYFGQAVILVLIQIGGLGVITIVSLLAMIAGKKISLLQRQTIQNALSAPQMGGVVRLVRFIIKTALAIEAIGAAALLPVFVPLYGVSGIWMSVFHSISAFCNAGFDLMGSRTGKFSSITLFEGNMYVTIIIALLIVIGGIGFLTWDDVAKHKFRFREYRLQSKVILITTFILIVVPAICFFMIDFKNFPINERICASVFQSITPRTAGFNNTDITKMTDAGKGLTILLMLIGGSPGSTAGGIKTTTAAILFANAIAVFRKRNYADLFGRRIADSVVKNAATIVLLYAAFSFSGACVISLAEQLPLNICMFETASAIGTVGLTLGITPGLGIVSQIILEFLMFFGRVGGLTLIYAAFSKRDTGSARYPLENVMVG